MRNKKRWIACGLPFALLFDMLPATEVSTAKKTRQNVAELTFKKGKSKTLKVKNAKKTVHVVRYNS